MNEILPLNSYMTDAGLQLIARSIAEGKQLTGFRAELGSGRVPGDVPFASLTGVVTPVPDTYPQISGFDYTAGNPSADITIQALPKADGSGYSYSEVALYARCEGDAEDVLLCYTPRYDYPAVVYPGGASETTVFVALSGVPSINITISPAALLTEERANLLFRRLDRIVPREWVENQIKQDEDIELLFGLLTNKIPNSTTFVISFTDLNGIEIIDGVLDPAGRRVWA